MQESKSYNIDTVDGLILKSYRCISRNTLEAAMKKEEVWSKYYKYAQDNNIDLRKAIYFELKSNITEETLILADFFILNSVLVEKDILNVQFVDVGSIEELRFLLKEHGYTFTMS